MQQWLQNLQHRLESGSIAILGFGREGRSTYRFIRSILPNKQIHIYDRNANAMAELDDKNISLSSGDDYLKAGINEDLIMISPGISLKNIDAEWKTRLSSQTDLFLEFLGDRCIGITGTKGKSTTTSLVDSILHSANRDSRIVGNIGVPVFDRLEDIGEKTWFVYELSAHQLRHVKHSPHVAVLLNIYPEHLDHYRSFEEYAGSKLNILKYQSGEDVGIVWNGVKKFQNGLRYDLEQADGLAAFRRDDDFIISANCSVPVEAIPLKGRHNQLNVLAAALAASSISCAEEDIIDGIKNFVPLEHRMEEVRIGRHVFYNDSISTIPESTIAALDSLERINNLIIGGYDRGLDYSELIASLNQRKIGNVYLIGETGKRLQSLLDKSINRIKCFDRLNEVIEDLEENEELHVLLSPAASSYDQYSGFEERGRHFKTLVKNRFES